MNIAFIKSLMQRMVSSKCSVDTNPHHSSWKEGIGAVLDSRSTSQKIWDWWEMSEGRERCLWPLMMWFKAGPHFKLYDFTPKQLISLISRGTEEIGFQLSLLKRLQKQNTHSFCQHASETELCNATRTCWGMQKRELRYFNIRWQTWWITFGPDAS